MTVASAAVLLMAAAGTSRVARAATIPVGGHSPGNVQKNCAGGTYFSPSSNGVYGCLAGDGSGIVCGGTGKDKKTCSTWGADARILPTQSQVREAEAKQEGEKAGK